MLEEWGGGRGLEGPSPSSASHSPSVPRPQPRNLSEEEGDLWG